MQRIRTLIVFAVMMALAIPAFAHKDHDQKRGKKHGKKDGNEQVNISPELAASLKEMRASQRQWAQDNMVPTLLVWKQQFDNNIEPADLATLNGLRSKAAEFRKQRQTLMAKAMGARAIGDKETAKQYKDALRDLRDDQHDIMDELRPLITKYSDILVAMHEEARPTLQSWRETRTQRWADWCKTASSTASTDNDKQFISRIEDRTQHGHEHGGKREHGKHAVVRFLLWDGVSNPEDEHEAEGQAFNKPGESPSTSLGLQKAFPNPADAQASVVFTTPAASAVTITLYDAAGNVVSVPVHSTFAEGQHTVDIPTQSLPSGSYRYSVEVNGTTQTGTLQVVH